jgi:hypothetical protein
VSENYDRVRTGEDPRKLSTAGVLGYAGGERAEVNPSYIIIHIPD